MSSHQRAGAAVLVIVLAAVTAHASPPKRPRGTMIDAIVRVSDFITGQPAKATSVAQRFGMHLNDYGESGNITFTPRDRRFSEGSANRQWKSQAVASVDFVIADDARLTMGELRAAFGRFMRSDGEHFRDEPQFIGTIDRDPKSPVVCDIIVQLAEGVAEEQPGDGARVKQLTLNPGPRFSKTTSSPSPPGR